MKLPLSQRELDKLENLHRGVLELFLAHRGQVLTPELCTRVSRETLFLIVLSDAGAHNLWQTLMLYSGKILAPIWCDVISRQLAARYKELELRPLQLFVVPTRNEWVALELIQVEETTWNQNRIGQQCVFYCLSGHPAGNKLSKKFPDGWFRWLAYKIGYNKSLRYEDEPSELIGFQFWGKIRIVSEECPELDFDDWSISPELKSRNAAIVKSRRRFFVSATLSEKRLAEYSCPFDYDHYCSECTRSAQQCAATYIRDRIYDRPLMDEEAPSAVKS